MHQPRRLRSAHFQLMQGQRTEASPISCGKAGGVDITSPTFFGGIRGWTIEPRVVPGDLDLPPVQPLRREARVAWQIPGSRAIPGR